EDANWGRIMAAVGRAGIPINPDTVDNNTACYNAVVGIEAYTSSVNNTIRSNNCSSNDYGIRIYASGNTIGWNLCDSNTNHGIYLKGGTNNLIENNTIRANANYGVYLTSSSSGNEFHNNTLTGNTGGTIYNNDSTDVNAQYNYWGTISETDIQNSTYDRRDDASKGWILYSPWWDSNFTTLHYADIDPPYTTDDYDGLWHRYDVLVTLTAIDNGTGVYATYYRIDGGAWQTGNNVTIHAWANHTNDGNHTIEYYSEDWARNNETVRSVTVHIDTTPPELRVFYENATDRVRKYAVDDLDPVPLKRMKKRGTLRTFILTDHAGNVAIIKADWYDGVKNGWRVR
ncbi:MAG TPA: hypothetical protein EYP14_13135, partial [Planctomycetaceae bacterium]|nr:hypothetical protein [Planctomycetaceae bacterium]